MNIFYLHKDPVESAKLHCDKHVCKMIIEYAQMLSTAHRILDGSEYISQTLGGRRIKRWKHPNSNMENVLYKASHINHPSTQWVRENAIQYQYAYEQDTCVDRYFDHVAPFIVSKNFKYVGKRMGNPYDVSVPWNYEKGVADVTDKW